MTLPFESIRLCFGKFSLALFATLAVLNCSCQSDNETSSANATTAVASSITIHTVDRKAYDRVIAKHRGKVVLVDCWATWCDPCKEHFPKTVQLGKTYEAKDFSLVSLSLDEEESEADALEFLTSMNAEFDNLRSKFGVGTKSVETFGIRGGVPFFKLYDRNGKLRFEFSSAPEGLENAESLEQIEPRIQELLGEESE